MKIDNELICLGEIGKVTTIAMEGEKSFDTRVHVVWEHRRKISS